jgi:hypothetical protein
VEAIAILKFMGTAWSKQGFAEAEAQHREFACHTMIGHRTGYPTGFSETSRLHVEKLKSQDSAGPEKANRGHYWLLGNINVSVAKTIKDCTTTDMDWVLRLQG